MGYTLLIDAGNTCIKFATAAPGRLFEVACLPTPAGSPGAAPNPVSVSDAIGAGLRRFLKDSGRAPEDMDSCLCASVTPGLDPSLAGAVRALSGTPVLHAPRDVPVPLRSAYPADQLGADRLVGVYGARRLFPATAELLCVDFGTAITFDLLAGDTYLGGLICPGVQAAADGLATRAERLPRVVLDERTDPTRLLGLSTQESMQFGLLQGFAALTDGLVSRITQSRREATGAQPMLIATGGMARVLAPASRCLNTLVENLVLQGLCFLL